jgi:hypothetical protein
VSKSQKTFIVELKDLAVAAGKGKSKGEQKWEEKETSKSRRNVSGRIESYVTLPEAQVGLRGHVGHQF